MKPIKKASYRNPLTTAFLCADPTAIEHEGRLYVYGSNDQQEYDKNGPDSNNTYGAIKSLVMLSTEDMVNWTHHGIMNLAPVCGSWMANTWAPSITSRVEDDGLTHFYLYFANSGGGIGVVTATSPVGPWTSPLDHALVSYSTPGLGECCWPFDPGVIIDENGQGWLTLGGGDPVSTGSKLLPGNARIVKLGDDMTSLASDFALIPAPYHFEASELNIMDGKFVYTYCSGWTDRDDWSSYGSDKPAPTACSMCYMVSDDPMNPDSWTYSGEYLKNPGQYGFPWGNNHTHLQKYGDDYYLFYHTQTMETLAGIKGAYRSISADLATVDETTQSIKVSSVSNLGVQQIEGRGLKPYEWNEAETMWNSVGLRVENAEPTGNAVLAKFEQGAWVGLFNVDFGEDNAIQFAVKAQGKGTVEIRIDKLDNDPVGRLTFNNSEMAESSAEIAQAFSGEHKVYLVFGDMSEDAQIDQWRFTSDNSGIPALAADDADSTTYNIYGLPVDASYRGIVIRNGKKYIQR